MAERHELNDDDDTLPFVRAQGALPPAAEASPARAGRAAAVPSRPDTLWDANDVAHYLKVSRSWVYHRAEAGLLPCVRVGGLLRFEPEAVQNFLRRR